MKFRWNSADSLKGIYPGKSHPFKGPYPDRPIQGFLLYQVSTSQEQRNTLQRKSEIDPLTGILNRGALKEKMGKLMEESNTSHQLAVIILDIDHFKQINDHFGHMTGDKVLVEASKNLHLLLRPVDLIGRLGGDEFMLCLKDIPYEEVIIRRVQLISKIIRSQLGAKVTVTASIGVAICPRDGTTFEELYKKADLALYKAKEQGRNCYVFYSSEISEDDWKPCITPIDERENLFGESVTGRKRRRKKIISRNDATDESGGQ
jgi:diguanylate cyclase (GGDEF)-like protein